METTLLERDNLCKKDTFHIFNSPTRDVQNSGSPKVSSTQRFHYSSIVVMATHGKDDIIIQM